MSISEYMRRLREKIGTSLIVSPSATALVFDETRRVLLLCHKNGGIWAPPGGAIDPDESPQDAVVREVWEETGLVVEPVALRGVFGGPEFRVTYENGDVTSYVTSVFECRRVGGELEADGEEILDARFFTKAEIEAMELPAWAKMLVPRMFTESATPWIPPVRWKPDAAK